MHPIESASVLAAAGQLAAVCALLLLGIGLIASAAVRRFISAARTESAGIVLAAAGGVTLAASALLAAG